MENTIAIYESKTADKVIAFIKESVLNKRTIEAINNGELWGIHKTRTGRLRAVLKDQSSFYAEKGK